MLQNLEMETSIKGNFYKKYVQSKSHLKAFILTSVNMLFILSLLGADKCGVLRPGGEGDPGVI